MKEKAVIYLRVSTELQDEQSQLSACKKLCEEKGYEVIGQPFKDHGKSAYHNVYRPQYEAIWKLIRNKEIQHVVVWAMDRWCRKHPDVYQDIMKEMEHYGVQLHPVQEQWIEEINAPGYMGRLFREFFYKMMAHFAHEESRLKSERVKSSKKFQKAMDKGTVGRPSIYNEVESKILELLKQEKKWKEIREQVTYKGKYGKVHHVSDPIISEVKKKNLL